MLFGIWAGSEQNGSGLWGFGDHGMRCRMLDRSDIQTAAKRLAPYVRRTPTMTLGGTSDLGGCPITLKLEFLQHTGSFKARGAFNRLLTATEAGKVVTAASGGNHGAAVAYAAQALDRRATIFVPITTPGTKVARIASYGAAVVQQGAAYADAYELSRVWAASHDALEVHAYDHAAVVAGQGTVGLELDEDAPDLTHVLVAVGGGGLIGGIGSWFAGSSTEVVGVEPTRCAGLAGALAAGRPVPVEVGGLAADSLGARQVGALMFEVAVKTGMSVVLVTDEAIRATQLWLWEELRIVAEPGGATAMAA
ncbi:MAG: serine/threonine dehydratase, partial [Janthinobacterium lividum]